MTSTTLRLADTTRALLTLALLAIGAAVRVLVGAAASDSVWAAALILTGAPLVWRTARGAWRGRFAADIVASAAILGAAVLWQPLAGLVIVLMQSGGEALERYAEGKASEAVRALERAAPAIAHRVAGGRVEDISVAEIAVGDMLLVRPGDLVPCDGVVTEGRSELNVAALTGEALPVDAVPGTRVLSGAVNGSGAFNFAASARASESQYERIVALVRTAQAGKAPIQRVADRYAVWFTPITAAACAAVWFATHDSLRVLAILVVATPCPLILAAPVAIIGGINRAARSQIIVRHGAALERLAAVTVVVFDKTGTVTLGQPRVREMKTTGPFSPAEVLRYAAALEQGSSHLLARVIVEHAEATAGLTVPQASAHIESPGQGVVGTVDGHEVHVGSRGFVLPHGECDPVELARLEGGEVALRAFVSIDGRLAGVIEYADEIRADLASVLSKLQRRGVGRILLLSGDHAPNVRAVAARAGITEAEGDLLPSDKAAVVTRLRSDGEIVLMVGDGTNDAPALSSADVGIALAARGGGITAEAADVIILVDSLERVPTALEIGRKTMRITRQSISVGLGLSAVAMLVAALGHIPPAIGAMLQETIDVAVILNALRASRS